MHASMYMFAYVCLLHWNARFVGEEMYPFVAFSLLYVGI